MWDDGGNFDIMKEGNPKTRKVQNSTETLSIPALNQKYHNRTNSNDLVFFLGRPTNVRSENEEKGKKSHTETQSRGAERNERNKG